MAHVWTNRQLDPIELASLYEWLDRVPLSRNRVQVEKDFADGLLAAEVVKFYFPDIIDMKELRTAKNLNERQMQWQFLNAHLFSKIGLSIPPHVMTQLCISKTGIAQIFLYNLRAILTLNGANTGAIPVPVFRDPPVIMRAPPPLLASSYEEMNWPTQNGRQQLSQIPLTNVYKDEYDYYWQKKQAERVVKSDKTRLLPKSNSMKGPSNNGRISLPVLKNPPGATLMAPPPISSYIVAAPPPIHLDLAAAKLQLDEKTTQIFEKEDEVQFLRGQLKRMEILLQNKNAKIQELLDLLDKEKKERERQRKPFGNF